MKGDIKIDYSEIYTKLYFWWIIITIIFELLCFFGINGILIDFLDLFVPIGNIAKLYNSIPIASIIVGYAVVAGLVFGLTPIVYNPKRTFLKNIMIIFLTLFVLTELSDLLIFSLFDSMSKFLSNFPFLFYSPSNNI